MWTPDLYERGEVKYLALVNAMSEAIASGALRPGDRLPTHRDLAWRLGLNVSTVTQAYREAARRHLVGGEVGRGTYVLADSREATLFTLKGGRETGLAGKDGPVDLSTNVPAADPENGDLEATLATMLTRGALAGAVGYHAPKLVQRVQAAGAAWIALRGLELRPREVAPCAGAQQALLAALLSICGPGAPVLVEEVTFPGVKAIARQLRLRLVGVPLDREGVLPDALAKAARASGARVAVLVPALQNPTGSVMGAERRRAVAAVVRAHDLTVIEDDVYGALTEAPALATEIPERTVLVTGLSKTVMPGLRVAFVAGRAPEMQAVADEVQTTLWPLSPLSMEVAATWIEDGTAARRLAWQRTEIEARHRIARRVLGREAGGPRAPHLWLFGRAGDAAQALAARARAAGVEVVPADLFATSRRAPCAVRVSLTAARTRRDLAVGLERLRSALDGASHS